LKTTALTGVKKSQKIATALDVNPPTCSNWKTRNTIPWVELFYFSTKKGISLDYLLTGKHPAEEVGDKTWTFSHEAKTEYPDLRHIVTHA
jgi:hypothetical protein